VNLDITPKKDPFSDTAVYEKRMEKLNQKSTQPTIIIGGNGSVVDSRGNVLHSGAPLVSQTGPESAIALALIGVAALSTLAYAFVRS
jgi:LPXTG-motif cell wall-anchored protein